MKKTLSILLSLLMVLSTVTCIFTMPASAEEVTTPTVETLPVNNLITNNGVKTITPSTAWTTWASLGYTFPTSVVLHVHNGSASNLVPGTVYQLTFSVTTSADINSGVTFRPVFQANYESNQGVYKIVGMRSEAATPQKAETGYNFAVNAVSNDKNVPVTKAEDSATLAPSKTYTYTYIFNPVTKWITDIRLFAEGLTAGSVTIGEAKLFPVSETDANNFYAKNNEVVYYAVEENGNVFTRMYGYRPIGDNTLKQYIVSAKVGGKYYNVNLLGGKTYNLSFDARYTSEKAFTNTDAYRSPAFDFFETGALQYNTEYNAIRKDGDTQVYNVDGDKTAAQREYGNSNNGYSYFYANSSSATRNRRIKENIATMKYVFADGTTKEYYQGMGSQQGRTATNEINNSTWIKGVYTLNAIGAQTLQEAATANESYKTNMRYSYTNGAWTFNSAMNNWYVSAKQDVTVALGMDFLYSGAVYDFDNFAITTDAVAVTEEYKNAEGEADTLANTGHNATKYYDALTGKTFATLDLFESDTVAFEGWYNGDTFLSADAEIEVVGDASNLKAVFTSKNILAYAGGFENYADGTNLEAAYTVVKAGAKPYPNYTAGEFRYYNSVPPTGDKWTGWDTDKRANTITDSDNGETVKKIIADIKAAGGVMDNTGYTGYTYFVGFPTIKSTLSETIFTDCGTYSKDSIIVTPYSGNKMLQLQASARTAIRALEGLTIGKAYSVSFYVFNPYKDYWLKDVDIRTQANKTADSVVLASYQEPYTVVTEDYVTDAAGNTATMAKFERITNIDHVQKWFKIELNFTATDTVAYITFRNQYPNYNAGHVFIDELTMVEYDCTEKGHIYDDAADITCNSCGEKLEYLTDWSFENGVTENITASGNAKLEVVDAVDQPEKIGSKYLTLTTAGFDGMAFNFAHEKGYKYKISYDFKIFTYGTGATSNGIDHTLVKYDDGKYGLQNNGKWADLKEASLNPNTDNIVTRYWENGQAWQKVSCFTNKDGSSFYGRNKEDGVYINSMPAYLGGAIWDEWQRVEIEIGTNNNYEGLVEYGIRPNDAGWVVGIDNFKVERVSTAVIDAANEATEGTKVFNIRAKTDEKQQGLRFKSTIDLDALDLGDGAKIVEYGTLAMRAERLNEDFLLVRQAAADKAFKAHVVVGIAYNEADGTDVRYAIDDKNNVVTYTGVLTGIGVKNYDVDFAVRGYVVVEDANGNRTTVYDDVVTMSVYDAALQIIEENVNENDIAVAQTIVDTYNEYTK